MLGFTIRQQQQQPSVGSALQKRRIRRLQPGQFAFPRLLLELPFGPRGGGPVRVLAHGQHAQRPGRV